MTKEINLEGIKRLSENAQKLDGTQNISMTTLISTSFMSNCSDFSNFEALIDASEFKVESQEDFESIPDREWDVFISKNTSFESWEAMLQSATMNYMKNNLMEGL